MTDQATEVPQSPGSAASTTTTTTTSSLTLLERLTPPLVQVGEGDDALSYVPSSPAWSVDFSRDGKWLAVAYGAPHPCVRVYQSHLNPCPRNTNNTTTNTTNTSTNNPWTLHATLDGIHHRTIRSVAFCPLISGGSAYILACASFDGSVSIWEYNPNNTWECTTQLEGHDNEVKAVTWNATGSLLATCGRDKTVWAWETWMDGSVGGSSMNEFECVAVLNGCEGDVKCLTFAPSHGQWGDGDEILISAGYDDTIRVWAEDAGDWYCAMSLDNIHTDTIWALAVSPSGGRLVAASADGSLSILKGYTANERKVNEKDDTITTGIWKCVGRLPDAHSAPIYGLDYAPAKAGHGRIVSSGADNRIQVYREASASSSDQPLFSLDAAVDTTHGDVNCVKWHPWDGTILCSAGDDGSVQLWNFESS